MVGTIALTPVYVGLGLWAWQVFDAAACVHAAQTDEPAAT